MHVSPIAGAERASAHTEQRERATARGRGAVEMPEHVRATLKRSTSANYSPAAFFRDQHARELAEVEAFVDQADEREAARQREAAQRARLHDPAVRRRQVAEAEAFLRASVDRTRWFDR